MKRLLPFLLLGTWTLARVAGADTPTLSESNVTSVFNAETKTYFPCDCDGLVNDINVTRAIDIAGRKYDLYRKADYFDIGMYYLDAFHTGMTHAVHVFSSNADRQLYSWVNDTAEEVTGKKEKKVDAPLNGAKGMSDYFNKLFRDQTYLYKSEASYMILRLGYETNKEEGGKFLNELRFAISLPQTENSLQLFVGDPLADENKEIVNTDGEVDTTTSVGARYFVPEFVKDLKTSATAGMRGVTNPFAQVRFEYPVELDGWLIRPVQYFEYSREREYYEETDLYFDHPLTDREMFRVRLKRQTETQKIGMRYNATVSYYNTFKYGTGLRTYAGLTGNTRLNRDRYKNARYDVDPSQGVYLYTIGMGWKQSFLRKWLFYEIEPRVEFDMLYDWNPNYVVRYWLEIFFGDLL